MNASRLRGVWLIAVLLASAGSFGVTWYVHLAAQAAASAHAAAADIDGMDRSVAPGDDFFLYANGGWLKTAEIPPDRSSYGTWSVMVDRVRDRTRQLLEAAARAAAGSDDKKAADYYATYLDEQAIEAKGIAPARPFLDTIAAIRDRGGLVRWACSNLRTDVDPLNNTNFQTDHLFGLWVSPALDDPSRYTLFLLQGGLGMPDRDYYLDPSPEMARVRARYAEHVRTLLRLAGVAEDESRSARVIALEEKIARAHATRTESVDVRKGNNSWGREEFAARAPGLDWDLCFTAAGVQKERRIVVWHPEAVTRNAALVGSEPLDAWRDYFAYHLVDRYSNVLPPAFADERFAFYGTVLAGALQQRPRWQRAIDATNGALGEAVGRLYVRRHFPPEAKSQLQAMVKGIAAAFDRRIDALDWMNPKTKASAKAKVATLLVGVGYPDAWRDYSTLEIRRGEAFMNAWRAELFDFETNRAKLGKPADRHAWAIDPQIVNALNLPVQNALNFPAAILQPPFFDPDAPAVMNYGAIGAVIGHEVSHSFDDQGSQFDATGRLNTWWTPEDFAHFKEASAKLVAQYNAYEPIPGLHVNGQLTLSENIADLAGLSAAYDAYRSSQAGKPARRIGELSEDQLFFISYARSWRTKMREPLLRQLLVTDGHAPDRYRVATVRNLDPWYGAFAVKPADKLFLAPADRVRIW